MKKKEREMLKLAMNTLLEAWNVLTQERSLKMDRSAMADKVCDAYEEISSYLSNNK